MNKLTLISALALFATGCGLQLPPNTVSDVKAVIVQTELRTEQVQKAERFACNPHADQSRPIARCDDALAAVAGLTSERHVAIERGLSQTFLGLGTAAQVAGLFDVAGSAMAHKAIADADVTAALNSGVGE